MQDLARHITTQLSKQAVLKSNTGLSHSGSMKIGALFQDHDDL